MDNLTYIAFIALTVSLALMLPLMEKKTRRVMIFMIVGIFAGSVAVLIAQKLPRKWYQWDVLEKRKAA